MGIQCSKCGHEGTAEEFGFKAEADKSRERTIIGTRLDIGISFRIGTVSVVDELREELERDIEEMGMHCESTGSGGGYQDMQFDGDDNVELALKAKQFAIDWLTKRIGESGKRVLDSGLWYVSLTEVSTIQI